MIHHISAEHLTVDRVREILENNIKIDLSEDAKKRIVRCREYLDNKMETQKEPIYGITTGFGSLCNISIDKDQLSQLQKNLVMSHACGKKEIVLAGTYARTNSLKGTIKGRTIASGVHDSRAARYDGHVEQLKKACVSLSGKPYSPGDAAFVFHVFPFLPLVFQFWESDEEFSPVLKFMWDENVLDYLRFETLYYVMGDFLDALDQAFDADRKSVV